MKRQSGPRRHALASASCWALCLGSAAVHAMPLDIDSEDWSIRWDNTAKLSAKLRTEAADPALSASTRELVPGVPASAFPQALNFNAGDQNFQKKGLVSERADLLSEFDAVWQNRFGIRLSGAAWYDAKLHQHTQADNDSSIGQTPYDRFPAYTQRMSGGNAELLDAFVFGSWQLGDESKLNARLGRHALQYGESLFFGDNGIARAQGPVDIDKLLASPNAQFKEVIRPVPQLSAQWQINPSVSLGGYVQFRWEADRLPPSGSYFSSANIPWGSEQPEFVGISDSSTGTLLTSYQLSADGNHNPRANGQFGLQLKWRLDETDLGFYYTRYHDKDGQLYGELAAPPGAAATGGGRWYYRFGDDINVVGASFSTSLGDFNVAGEASVRNNMPLHTTSNYLYGFYPGQAEPAFQTGRTAHLNLSTLATFGPNVLAEESALVAEVAWNRVLHTEDFANLQATGRTRDASIAQFVYTPSYRQVLPGLDLSVPLGLRYSLSGKSAVTAWDAKGNGTLTLGVSGNYVNAWQFAMTYSHYLGKAVPVTDYSPALTSGAPIFGDGNALADRDHIALSLQRSF